MNRFEQLLDSIVGDTQTKAAKLLDLWEAGHVDDDLFTDALVHLIDQSRGKAANAAVNVLRDYVEEQLDAPVLVDPSISRPRTEALNKAVGTILAADADTRMQVERLATGETLDAAHYTYGNTLRGMREVEGWTRGLEADACQLCRWWARDGRVWKKQHRMPVHTGCKCHQIPTVTKTDNYQTTNAIN